MKTKEMKGITLVALVVTIVVLLILAGVSINLVLGNNGIIAKAKDAETKSAKASENDLTGMSNLEDEMEKQLGIYDPLKKIPTKTLEEAKSDFVKEKTKVVFSDGNVIVPEGFKIADVTVSKVQDGVVIEDKDENQFVWVPVATIANYKRSAYSPQVATEEKDTATNSIKIKNNSSQDSYYKEALPEDEKNSVMEYKGFYIGRYEAGDKDSTEASTPALRTSSSSTSNKVSIKKGQAPYTYVTRTQAISLAEGLKTQQNYNATTKLVSSYAWDTTIEFIQKVNSDYGNSSEEGNYLDTIVHYTDITTGKSETKEKGSGILVPTGQTTPVCNIYDMGGNAWEWTTENYSIDEYPCAKRGGNYSYSATSYAAGSRDTIPDNGSGSRGFRIALFL